MGVTVISIAIGSIVVGWIVRMVTFTFGIQKSIGPTCGHHGQGKHHCWKAFDSAVGDYQTDLEDGHWSDTSRVHDALNIEPPSVEDASCFASAPILDANYEKANLLHLVNAQ